MNLNLDLERELKFIFECLKHFYTGTFIINKINLFLPFNRKISKYVVRKIFHQRMDDKFCRELQLYCLVKIYWHNLKIKEVFEKICRGDVRIKDFMEQMQQLFEFYDNKKKEIEGGLLYKSARDFEKFK